METKENETNVLKPEQSTGTAEQSSRKTIVKSSTEPRVQNEKEEMWIPLTASMYHCK